MRNFVKQTACALAVLATSSAAMAAESLDIKVIGTITPAACVPTLSGGGTIDYGTIPPDSLKQDAFTTLDEKQINFTITCDAPTKVAVTAKSGRGASAVQQSNGSLVDMSTGNNGMFDGINISAVGLGLDGDKGIGGYGLRLAIGTMVADGTPVDSIQSDGNTTSWSKAQTGSMFSSTSQRYVSWAASGTLEPVAFTTLTGKLGAQAYINKASELDLTKPVQLDGLSTLTLVYL